jgi:hypothetical protein
VELASNFFIGSMVAEPGLEAIQCTGVRETLADVKRVADWEVSAEDVDDFLQIYGECH